ncbi:uncharacterized protein LOC103569436 [Microplitis demolitor]|uniref:uncharacterized protein LOC103569436 n=1 Tax=Microplitis demolitor TaxID=69319 RepID=UPI0004CD9BF3|nr:uncharacterized protein LOC103569436 [Microplitis demolitor]
MGRFPDHLFLKIFKRLSVRKLIFLKIVHKRFYNLITKLLSKKKNLWRDAAQADIPRSVLCLFIKKRLPSVRADNYYQLDDEDFWKNIHLIRNKWEACASLAVDHEQKIVQDLLDGHVSCIATSDKYLAIGTKGSKVNVYKERDNYHDYDGNRYEFLFGRPGSEDQSIVKLIYWYTNKKKIIVTLSKNNNLKFWDLVTGKEFIDRQEYSAENICAGTDGSFYSEFHGTVLSYTFKFGIFIKRLHEADLDQEKDEDYPVDLLSVEKNIKVIWPQAELINIADILMPQPNNSNTVTTSSYSIKLPARATKAENKKFYLLSLENSRSIIATYDNYFAIHQEYNNWREFDMLDCLGGKITYVTLHGDLLILNILKVSGQAVTRVNTANSFFSCKDVQDFYTMQSKEMSSGNSKIFAVDTIDNRNYPALAVTTENFVNIIYFHPMQDFFF